MAPSRVASWLFGLVTGVAVGVGVSRWEKPSPYVFPAQLTTGQQMNRNGVSVPMPPMTAEVRFMAPDDYYKALDAIQHVDAALAKNFTGATTIEGGKCVILLKAGLPIDITASQGWARFASYQAQTDLDHELTHCAYGWWHPSWNDIKPETVQFDRVVWPEDWWVWYPFDKMVDADWGTIRMR